MRLLATVTALFALLGGATTGWRTFRAHALSIRIPPGWSATSAALTPVTWPPQVLAVASYPLPHSDRGADGCEPKAALDRLPPRGAFIFGWEYTSWSPPPRQAKEFPPRPAHFRLGHRRSFECLNRSYLLRFRDAGRYFQVHVVLGRDAGRETRALVLRVLDSLRVSRR